MHSCRVFVCVCTYVYMSIERGKEKKARENVNELQQITFSFIEFNQPV